MTVVDMHVHVGESLYGNGLGAEQLLRRMDELAIDRAVIVPPKPSSLICEPSMLVSTVTPRTNGGGLPI